MILEGIVTTLGPGGEVNVAPMGPHLPDLLDDPTFPRRDPLSSFVLKPFRGSRTYANLQANGEGVFHVTDDVLLLAQSVIDATPADVPTFPASRVRGAVLRDACRYAEFRVVDRDDRDARTTLHVEVVHRATLRDFFGFNRAMAAVVEAAILASRLAMLPVEQVEAEFARLAIPVGKTGGMRERQAFAVLQAHLRQWREKPR